MNVQELCAAVMRLGGDARDFVIDGAHEPLVPSEGAVYLSRVGGHWETGIQERGWRESFASFATEDEACRASLADRTATRGKGRR